ncbi:ABC transporter permease subunit [Xinfangfangia sp. CPCC 101601]|uniref:ABC transporter permease subunit n=1 Tax=Pseudogemmobacter lacusdianii TaxID=3069608 RepID=A0ABU0W225_9RHOB|nr:ABC transporter permease subunit [Xinfangfangia sp. CPCC 101601]MDQ2067480.1 ABC transporter permease subunit [Xinfangfangia sp. CPCC 101601]
MTLATSTPPGADRDGFRLSMLIYDTRFRAITIQVVVLVLVLLLVGWLVDNTIQNLNAKGKDINFSFLWVRAGYDIEQQLIPYTNDSTHGRAVIIGLLNTLLVAIVGCFFATIIGVIAGVLRLSNNWLVSRLMTVYVEAFRNIPLLLWIVVIFVVTSETQPAPNEFKVTQAMVDSWQDDDPANDLEPTASKILFGTVAVTNRGSYMATPMLDRPLGSTEIGGVPVNFSVLAALAVVIGSILVNRAMLRRVKAQQEATGERPTTWWKSLLILFGPIALLLLAMGFHLQLPAFASDENGVSKGFNFQGGILVQHSFTALTLALALYTGAFIAEIVRAGILAISRGQTEASFALGIRPGRTMSLIILPQALRVIIPPLISQYLNLTKNTSLGIAVSYLDLRGTLGGITLNQTGRELECMLLMMLTYLIISLIISGLMNIYNNAVKLKER